LQEKEKPGFLQSLTAITKPAAMAALALLATMNLGDQEAMAAGSGGRVGGSGFRSGKN